MFVQFIEISVFFFVCAIPLMLVHGLKVHLLVSNEFDSILMHAQHNDKSIVRELWTEKKMWKKSAHALHRLTPNKYLESRKNGSLLAYFFHPWQITNPARKL